MITLTDSYKVTHWKQYPPKTEKVYSYFESRGGLFDGTVFFGLHYFLMEYLAWSRVTEIDITHAERVVERHIGPGVFNREGWEHLVRDHNGCLPLSIRAVPEGTHVPNHNVLMTVENTCPKCYWLPNYLETLLVQVWYPTTVCTLSNRIKLMIGQYMDETAGHREGLDFKLHDFGFRGVSSVESAGIGGCAHLANFKGTDTMAALEIANFHYDCPNAGFSIPAAEHSTITSWGRGGEKEAFENMLDQFPTGLVAVVSDSYNIFHACEEIWGEQLKSKVLNRDGTVVIRPDSGEPVETVISVLGALGKKLGYSTNQKGFKVLDPHVRVIQGDGVNYDTIRNILSTMKQFGWSAENVAFGMGGALLQNLNRDTQKFAFKCSYVEVDGEERMVFKSPVTDTGKRSKAGRLALINTKDGAFNGYQTVNHTHELFGKYPDQLQEVFRDGQILISPTLGQVRRRIDGS